ncbi:MAG: GNAT family N-acetyltransferase [Treponema sp.]|nr:GNAT family N-acetyltransferase [Treponema sp.]
MILRYTESGYLVIFPRDNPHKIVDAMLGTGYGEEFCVSPHFEPDFIARLMQAGFLVMSSRIADLDADSDAGTDAENTPRYILLPKLHLSRSALFFDNLHVKKSIRRHLGRYDLRADADFHRIVDRCLAIHGDDWLTPPLVAAIRQIRQGALRGVYPMSFALYRDGELVAGEFGVQVGKVYTSYSGYYDEDNAGTAQIILATRYLQENGYAFFDLGMPLDYKTTLGAVDISPQDFVALFRLAQNNEKVKSKSILPYFRDLRA